VSSKENSHNDNVSNISYWHINKYSHLKSTINASNMYNCKYGYLNAAE